MDARRLTLAAGTAAVLAGASPAGAGHVVGLGHYRYDPDTLRPQLRVERQVDDHDFAVSASPGDPSPGEAVTFEAVVTGPRGAPAEVSCTVHRVGVLGARRRIVDRRAVGTGAFEIAFDGEGEYEVTLALERPGGASALSFPFVVGRPGSPWAILGGFAGGLAAFVLGVAVAGRIRGGG